MIGPTYIHMERINTSTFRLSVFVDAKGVETFLSWLRGRGTVLCEPVVEGGYTKTKSTPVDDILSNEEKRRRA